MCEQRHKYDSCRQFIVPFLAKLDLNSKTENSTCNVTTQNSFEPNHTEYSLTSDPVIVG